MFSQVLAAPFLPSRPNAPSDSQSGSPSRWRAAAGGNALGPLRRLAARLHRGGEPVRLLSAPRTSDRRIDELPRAPGGNEEPQPDRTRPGLGYRLLDAAHGPVPDVVAVRARFSAASDFSGCRTTVG